MPGRQVGGIAEEQAQVRIAGVRFLEHQKAMRLRAHVIHAEHGVGSQSALEREHVFLGVRNAIGGRVVRQPGDGLELRPVDVGVRVARACVQRRKRDREIPGRDSAGRCGNERCGEQRRGWAGVGGSVGRIGAHHANRESLDRGVKHAIAGADAGLAGTAQYFGEQAVAGSVGRIGQADARRKIAISRRRQGARHSGIGGIKDSGRRSRENHRLPSGHERRDLVVLLIPGLDAVPAQTVIQREVVRHAPAILPIEAHIFIAAVKRLQLALVVLAGNSQQEIRKVGAGLAAEEKKAAVELRDGVDVDLIVVEFAAHFDGVGSDHFGKIVEPLKGVADLLQLVGVGADGEAVEADAFHSLGFRRQRHDSRSSRPTTNPCDARLTPTPPDWLAEVVRVAHVAEVEFVHGGRAERLGIAQGQAIARGPYTER